MDDKILHLNVGGTTYTTTRSTLTRHPESMLGAMFSGKHPSARDGNGHYFIDRDGPLFRFVLNFLRCGRLNLPKDFNDFEQLHEEADFYQIQPLIDQLNDIWNDPNIVSGLFIEVKDYVQCYKGWHINTSLTGPFELLKDRPPFNDELSARAYRTWRKGQIEELYLEKALKTRLEWAVLLKRSGWQFLSTTSSSHFKIGEESQQFIVIDKWFLPNVDTTKGFS